MAKQPRPQLTVYLGAGTSPEDRQLRSKLRMKFAAEGFRTHGWPGLLLDPKEGENPLDGVRSAIAESDCVVLLATAGYLKSRRPSSDWGIAFAYDKPIYVVIKDVSEQELPAHMRSFPVIAWRNLNQLIDLVRQHQLDLSKPEKQWLWQWYKGKRLPLEGVIRRQPVLHDLATGFHKVSNRKVAPEKLLGELFRMRKQGKLPAPRHKEPMW